MAGSLSRKISGWWPACAATVACAAIIAPVHVPHKLSDRTQLELSGAAWAPTLSRYLLVSDDVNDEGDKHRPWLFTLNTAGKLDAKPIEIEGAGDFNDAESITPGPSGTFFVCTSHSLTRKGQALKSRRRLLQIALTTEHKARILGEVDLTTARGTDGKPPWVDESRLDIEGIAYRDGDLLIGLKAPLAADGHATILRLIGVVGAVKSGSLPPGALVPYAQPRLCVPREGHEVCQGVADIAVLPGGALLLAANSPKNMPSDGGGAIWKLSTPNAAPQMLHRFEGLKPEGVALAPNGNTALVVFDTDRKKPLWMTLSLSP